MNSLFHPAATLSISLCAAALLGAVASANGAPPANGPSPYFGRWTVDDANAPFSSRGREYKTFDVAPCGKDFCGVSVNDAGSCGKVLFRFLSKNRNAEQLNGHGKWGASRLNVVIYHWEADSDRMLQVYLGEGYDLGDRGSNMPKYEAAYRRVGNASCVAR